MSFETRYPDDIVKDLPGDFGEDRIGTPDQRIQWKTALAENVDGVVAVLEIMRQHMRGNIKFSILNDADVDRLPVVMHAFGAIETCVRDLYREIEGHLKHEESDNGT